MKLVTEEMAETLGCPYHHSKLCEGPLCMAWQWEDLGHMGGVADRGFCGMVATGGKNANQPAELVY